MNQTDTAAPAEWQNLLGVCAALGEDLGVNPLWFRLAFAMPLIWNFQLVIGAYLAMGAVVLASRLAFPNPRRRPAADPVIQPRVEEEPELVFAKAA